MCHSRSMPASSTVPRDTARVKARILKCSFYFAGPGRFVNYRTKRKCRSSAVSMVRGDPACLAHKKAGGNCPAPWYVGDYKRRDQDAADQRRAAREFRVARTEVFHYQLRKTRRAQTLAMQRAGIPVPLIDAIVVACEENSA